MESSKDMSDMKCLQEHRYQTIFDSDMIGIVAGDLSGRIFDANDYFLKLVGYTRQELEAGELNWMNITLPEDIEKSRQAAEDILEKKTLGAFEKEYIHKDGHRVPVMLALTPFKDGTVVALVLDISQRRNVERELEQSKTRVEERVDARTQELR